MRDDEHYTTENHTETAQQPRSTGKVILAGDGGRGLNTTGSGRSQLATGETHLGDNWVGTQKTSPTMSQVNATI